MSASDSVSAWIGRLQEDDSAAFQQIWERYFQQLVSLARKKLRSLPRRVADEEDVALEAFHSFCRGAREGRFPKLVDRNDLWQLLVMLTARKAANLQKHIRRQKRGGGKVRGDSALQGPDSSSAGQAFVQLIDKEPTPEFAVEAVQEFERLLDSLGDDNLRSIALWKMEGFTHEEIAAKLACATVTVERRLRLIRSIWQKEIPA
jgi:DNA-directed RNA polymerase specialized sigma24 family protein